MAIFFNNSLYAIVVRCQSHALRQIRLPKQQNNFQMATSVIRTMSSSSSTDEVLFETKGNKGVITLNRPKALNALNLNMVRSITPQLTDWNKDSSIKMVIIKGAGTKAFCAGGDVRAIAESGQKSALSRDFFREEYTLNYLISALGVPYISLIQGICMGGGVGLSVHGTYRVVTEKTVFAMPEMLIGFFADVGGSYFLPKLPGKLGTYLALTGKRLEGLDIVKAGIATHFVPSSHLNALEEDLLRIERPDRVAISHLLSKHQEQWINDFKQEFALKPYVGRINNTFGAESVEKIFEHLRNDTSSWAREILDDLSKVSPLSLKVTFEMLKRGQNKMISDCLKMEYRISQNLLEYKDFFNGVRARLIEKTNNPVWQFKTLEEISDDLVNSIFKPIPNDNDLNL